MQLIDHIPAVLRILAVFAVILIAIRKKMSLGNAFIIGSLGLGLVFGMAPPAIFKAMLLALMQPKTLSLAAIVSLILVLSHSMEASGQMKRLLTGFQGLVRHAGLNMIVFPALIGLLPMPGGAVFSAPMVKNLAQTHRLSGAAMSYVNYWFRHIWEYWWPLYPGVLLTTTLAGIDLWWFVCSLFPLTLVAVFFGYWPLKSLRNGPGGPEAKNRADRGAIKQFLFELQPIAIAIGLGLGLGAVLTPLLAPLHVTIAKELGLIAALLLAIGNVWRLNRMTRASCWQILTRKDLLKMGYMVAGILIFKGILQDSQAVSAVGTELMHWHIPIFSITIILPMLVGAVCGITIAFVGTTFPILISLVHSLGLGHLMLAYMMLALASGFVGVLFSPLHLCLLLSNEYFNTTLGAVYRYLWPPCLAILAAACAYFFLLQYLL